MSTIFLKDLCFYGCHGILAEERKVPQKFVVCLKIMANTSEAETRDDIIKTVDYSIVFKIVSDEFAETSLTLEHLARRIIQALKKHFQQIEKITVRIEKSHAPLAQLIGQVGVEIEENF